MRRGGASVRQGRVFWLNVAVVWRRCGWGDGESEEDRFNDEGRVREKNRVRPVCSK